MSRTKKGKKSPGHDYWGKRPFGFGGHGTKGKRDGIQRERAAAKQEVRKEPQEPEYDPREYVPSEELEG